MIYLICKTKIKDFFENEVDEKYYLSEKGIGRLIKKNNKLNKFVLRRNT